MMALNANFVAKLVNYVRVRRIHAMSVWINTIICKILNALDVLLHVKFVSMGCLAWLAFKVMISMINCNALKKEA